MANQRTPSHPERPTPLADAAAVLQRRHTEDLATALAVARAQGLPEDAVDATRLGRGFLHLLAAWRAQRRPIPGHGLVKAADPDEVIWAVAAREPLSSSRNDPRERDTTLLSEIAWSLGCEQNRAWRDPADLDRDLAELAFARLVQRSEALLQAIVRKQCAALRDRADEVAMQGCAEAFRYYWSEGARTRFLVTSRISTMLHGVVVREVQRLLKLPRDRALGVADGDGDRDGADGDGGATNDPPDRGDALRAFMIRDAYRHCFGQLTERQQGIVRARLEQGRSNQEVAAEQNVTAPAITMHYQQALRNLMECLQAEGVAP